MDISRPQSSVYRARNIHYYYRALVFFIINTKNSYMSNKSDKRAIKIMDSPCAVQVMSKCNFFAGTILCNFV